MFEQCYTQIADQEFLLSHIRSTSTPQHKMQLWSSVVEKPLRTLRTMHMNDPIKWQQKGLPPHFRDRCCPPQFQRTLPTRSPRRDSTNAFNPVGEPTRLQTLHKVRQTRRLASLFRQYNRKLVIYDRLAGFPCFVRNNLQAEGLWSILVSLDPRL